MFGEVVTKYILTSILLKNFLTTKEKIGNKRKEIDIL
jgi:hypothetical protein